MVHAIIHGELRNHERVEARRRKDGEPDDDTTPSSWPDPELRLVRAEDDQELKADLHALLGKLTPDQRTMLTLDHIDDLTIKEIAVITDKKPGTVAVELHRARKRLRELCARSTTILKRLRRQ
jgi:RNA polymerase sigma-70 factor (ECF subfamily)